MLKVAIVGCGKIADSHAAQILRIDGCEIVGVCDREPLMARQLYERFPIKQHYGGLTQLLDEAKPDVVHITTPPESHVPLAMECLKHGCHVYVEKPFALSERDTRGIIAYAETHALRVTAGHDDQFSHVTRRMRSLVHSGFLGGPPVHMESYYCYEFGQSAYANAVLRDKAHWVRRLPGKLLHNIISHGIARIAEFLTGDSPQVITMGFTSPWLKSTGEEEIIDELRVLVSEERGATASFTFSSQMRPGLHAFRVYGPRNGLLLDQDQETLVKLRGKRYTSYAEKFIPPVELGAQFLGNWLTNMRRFLGNDFHMKSGMKYLIESFYQSITDGLPPPIPYREIILTARIMDAIFTQLDAQARQDLERPICVEATV
jgi:predicted dehydrogenase